MNPQCCGEPTEACPLTAHPHGHRRYYQGDLKRIKSDGRALEVRVQGMEAQDLLDPSRERGKAWAGMNVGQLSAAQPVSQAALQLL